MPHEAGNDFRFADWRMDLLEEWSAESENALGLHCSSRSLDSPNSLEAAWGSFRRGLSKREETLYVYKTMAGHKVRNCIQQLIVYIILSECCI